MTLRAHRLSTAVARGLAVPCAAVVVASAPNALAGINVWTSHGKGVVHVTVLAIDPTMPSTLYAGTPAMASSRARNGTSFGGGSANFGTATITNSTFTGNIGSARGIGNGNTGSLSVTSGTFTGNSAFREGGGGIHGGPCSATPSSPTAPLVAARQGEQ